MPLATITLAPGVDTEKTPTLNSGGYTAANCVRFREGLAEKDGGWQRYINAPVIGTGRGMEAWADLSSNSYLAVGTEQQLDLVAGGTLNNITPIQQTDNLPGSGIGSASSLPSQSAASSFRAIIRSSPPIRRITRSPPPPQRRRMPVPRGPFRNIPWRWARPMCW